MNAKAQAYDFLYDFRKKLDAELPFGPGMDAQIREIVRQAKADPKQKHKTGPEFAFVNHFVFPRLHEAVSSLPGYTNELARQSLLSELFRYDRERASGTPARLKTHPFGKTALGFGAPQIIKRWKGLNGQQALTQSCPDFALCAPHRIVFEGKYFHSDSVGSAESALVSGIFEAFHYRALPYVAPAKGRAAWDYEYACLVAFDASRKGVLSAAWNSLSSKVRDSFWDSGNIFVMVLRGSQNTEALQ